MEIRENFIWIITDLDFTLNWGPCPGDSSIRMNLNKISKWKDIDNSFLTKYFFILIMVIS